MLTRSVRAPLAAAVLSLLPVVASADRGALSVDAGPVVSALRSPPAIGTGDAVFGTLGGAAFGVRYALQNYLEVSVNGSWFNPVRFYNDNTVVSAAGGSTVSGKLQAKVGRIAATAGLDYVRGDVWRTHVGAQIGWANLTYENVSHSAGLTYGTTNLDALVVAPRVGLEWCITDHISVSAMPTLEFLVGSRNLTAFTLPVLFSYSWYSLL